MSFIASRQKIFRARVRSLFLDTAKVKKIVGEANHDALYKAGFRIKQAAKKGIGNAAPHVGKARKKKSSADNLVDFAGGLYKDMSFQSSGKKSRAAGKPIKSWAPRRFVYYDIKDYFDLGGQAVVIGPYRAPWLMRLHEFGGGERLTGYVLGQHIARRAAKLKKDGKKIPKSPDGGPAAGYIRWQAKGFKNSKNWERTSLSKSVRYPSRPFMQGSSSVHKALDKIANDFKDTLKASSGGVSGG